MVNETHKIWGQDDVSITATCIRVPVMRAHAESINLELSRDLSEAEVLPLLFAIVTTCLSSYLDLDHSVKGKLVVVCRMFKISFCSVFLLLQPTSSMEHLFVMPIVSFGEDQGIIHSFS